MTIAPDRTDTSLEALIEWLDESPLKYEVIDGTVVVSPAPTARHEDNTAAVLTALRSACPPELIVLGSYGWRYDPSQPYSYLDPDTVVVSRDGLDLDANWHDNVPLLALETRSPSTRRLDEGVKRDLYAEGGVASYWLLDPRTPRLRILELRDGEYVETAVLDGPGELTVERPFPVTLRLPSP